MLENCSSRRFVAFDTCGKFTEAHLERDKAMLKDFKQAAGDQSISRSQLQSVPSQKNVNTNIDLIEGDISATVPDFVERNPGLRLSLIHLDLDI